MAKLISRLDGTYRKNDWTDTLSIRVYNRLCACTTIKGDLEELVQARWDFYKNNKDYTKGDALVEVLDLLDCNSRYFGLTESEWNDILQLIYD